MGQVLFVSKPVEPPWNDSSKNLVRDLATHLRGHTGHVMVGNKAPGLGDSVPERVYRGRATSFSPRLGDQLRVLQRLAWGPRVDLLHFFFAPNPRTSMIAAACAQMRRVPALQTVCSAPKRGVDLERVLFGERVVVLSEHTRARFLRAGIAAERVVHIPPCVPPLSCQPETLLADDQRGGPVLLYPGDLEFSAGADRCLELLCDLPQRDAVLWIAARMKTPRAAQRQRDLSERAAAMGLDGRVRFLGEVGDMRSLLSSATCVLLPAETLYAKMDLPLVLLEAMQVARPVVVLEGTPAAELAKDGAALAVVDDRDVLSDVVATLLDDPAKRARIGAAGRARVARDFGPEAMAQRYALLYDQLLGPPCGK